MAQFIPGKTYVAQWRDKWVVFINGQQVGEYDTQEEAQQAFNAMMGESPSDETGKGQGKEQGKKHPGDPYFFELLMEGAYQQALLDYNNRRLDLEREIWEFGKKPDIESAIRVREAYQRLQEAQLEWDKQKFKALQGATTQQFDVLRALDVWKEKARQEEAYGKATGLYAPPVEGPTLPYHYMRDQIVRDFRSQYDRNPTPEEVENMLPWYSTGGAPVAGGPSAPAIPSSQPSASSMYDWALNVAKQTGKLPSAEEWRAKFGPAGEKVFEWSANLPPELYGKPMPRGEWIGRVGELLGTPYTSSGYTAPPSQPQQPVYRGTGPVSIPQQPAYRGIGPVSIPINRVPPDDSGNWVWEE